MKTLYLMLASLVNFVHATNAQTDYDIRVAFVRYEEGEIVTDPLFDLQFYLINEGETLMEPPQDKKLIVPLKFNPQIETDLSSVDRIGRSSLDILQIIEFFKKMTC